MEKNKSLTINLSYSEGIDLNSFITLNNIEDEAKFNKKCWKQGFDIEKYGLLVPIDNVREKIVEIEKIVEVPVDRVVEVEVVKEIVKEVVIDKIIEKEIFITDDQKVNELILKLEIAENKIKELSDEITELSSIQPVEKIVEVPVEIVVEKVIEVNNNEDSQKKQQMLQDTIQKLRQELQNKTQEISDLTQKLNNRHFTSDVKGIYLDGSNLNKTIKTN
jgi:predicted RNase H-like nuclease (RuvC/YqgF family)